MREETDHLLASILSGNASKEQILEFSEWIKDYHNEQYFAKVKEMWHVAQDMAFREHYANQNADQTSQAQTSQAQTSQTQTSQTQTSQTQTSPSQKQELERFMRYIRKSRQRALIKKISTYTTTAAAAIVLLAAILRISGIIGIGVNRDFNTLAYSTDSVKVEYFDGEMTQNLKGTKGSITVIDPTQSLLAESGNATNKATNKASQSQRKSISGTETSPKKGYNSISTPPGERVAMVLSDGTRVYLTSNSYLKYPSSFDTDKREVTLVGRAYFEVSKSKVPFIVSTSDMEVEVLGTSFDVESRTSNNSSNVILVEGSVKVNTNKESRIIKPNEQISIHRKTKQSTITTVDSKLLTMWKDGVLIVRGQTFGELIESLSAWYGVKIIDRTNLNTIEKFNGRFDREDIEAAIQAVCISARIKYKIVNGYLVLEDL
jgi:ferric-dicitrate binding protein FerR (iron transport regulator)